MEEWQVMFCGVQSIARSASSFSDGLEQAIRLARGNAKLFDEPNYWDRVEQHNFSPSIYKVVEWAKEGLQSLDHKDDWDFLVLDLGDCPETFYLSSLGGQSLMQEDRLRDLMLSNCVVGAEELEACLSSAVDDPYTLLYGCGRVELSDHNVRELSDDLLTWNTGGSVDWAGHNGDLLWLAFGSLALLEPLRNIDYCQRILNGRSRLYLLAGFESIFLYLATVTPQGLLFERDINQLDALGGGQMRLPLEEADS